jgi:RimJ/RimL family protein N-acetyltransferase
MVRANSIELRPSAIDDLASVHSLYRAVAERPGGLARLPVEITRSYVENFLHATISRGLGFVAVDERKEIVAEIHSYSPEIFCFSHILTDLTIAVHPSLQGQGLGRDIFTHFLSSVNTQRPQINRVELIARESNKRALAFYASLGFRQEGELQNRVLNLDGSLESDIPMAWLRSDTSVLKEL